MKTYQILDSFNLVGFLDSCRASGVKLSKETPEESVDGFIEMSKGELSVHLDTQDWSLIDSKVAEFNI